MHKNLAWMALFLTTIVTKAQERTLPTDFRQHTLTQFNASLLNATYSLDWNNPHALSIWSRWQWQTVDGDPTTLFVGYTHQLNQNSAAGLAFLQHNTGTYLNTGLNLNYVHAFRLEDNVSLFLGTNVFGFNEQLADDRFMPDPDIDLPGLESTDDFILQFSPAIRLQVNRFNVGLAIENAIDVNLSGSSGGQADGGTVVIGTLSNDFPVFLFGDSDNNFVRPVIYVKSIPNEDTQFGINSLFSTSRFWAQGGYNSFYGFSGGLGVTFAKQFSLGGLLEVGTDSSLSDEKSTVEIIVSYHFGKTDSRKKVVGFNVEKDDELAYARIRAEEEQRKKLEEEQKQQQEELAKQEEKLRNEKEAEHLAEERRLEAEQQVRDSIAQAEVVALKLKEQQRLDSIAQLSEQKVDVRPNEKYEEVASAAGLEPGFYLIANVFGTKKYYEAFMTKLTKQGLTPKSFYRELNKYRYVYLERYNTMGEARKARDTKFNGKYPDKTWIFRVRGN